MTIFHDGPAQGQHLMLRRAPLFLRVTHRPADQPATRAKHHAEKWDGLDQIGDEPLPVERLFAYALMCAPGSIHIRASKGAGGFFPMSTYKLVDPQPGDAVMRSNQAWQVWCAAQEQPEWWRRARA